MSALYFAQAAAAHNARRPIYADLGLSVPALLPVPVVKAPPPPAEPDPFCESCRCPLSVTEEKRGWCDDCAFGEEWW